MVRGVKRTYLRKNATTARVKIQVQRVLVHRPSELETKYGRIRITLCNLLRFGCHPLYSRPSIVFGHYVQTDPAAAPASTAAHSKVFLATDAANATPKKGCCCRIDSTKNTPNPALVQTTSCGQTQRAGLMTHPVNGPRAKFANITLQPMAMMRAMIAVMLFL